MAMMKVVAVLCIFPYLINTLWAGFFPETSLKPESPEVCTMEDLTLTYFPKNVADLGNASLKVYGRDGYLGDWNATRELNLAGGYVTFILHNITQSLNNANIYICSGNCATMSNTILLKVYETPQPVKNFSCKVFNYFDGMICSWELGADYKWITQHVLKWRIPTYHGDWNNCPNQTDTSCYWRGTQDGDYSMKKIDILLTLEKSQCRQAMVQNFSVDAGKIVEPAPVTSLLGSVINSTCINITWTSSVPQYHKIHNVIYDSHWNKSQNVTLEDEIDEATKQLTVCDLHPATNYTFLVTVMPKQGGYWSQSRAINLATYYDLPSASPKIVPWTFSQSPQHCDSLRIPVTIHWLPVPEFYHNGPLQAYTVIVNRVEDDNTVTKETINEAPGDRTQLTLYLMCTNTYIIVIHPRNSVGYSKINSSFIIPAVKQVPPQPEFFIERANKTSQNGLTQVTLTLMDVGHNVNPLNYTVFWCTMGELGACAEASLAWRTFPASEPTLELYVPDPESLLMGVSMETLIGKSVVTWKSCIYAMHAEPSRQPRNVGVREGSGDRTLLVTWDKIPCEPGQPYIHQYLIRYCRTGPAGTCEESNQVRVGSESSRVELQDLKADYTYNIAVQGVTRTELVGPLSLYVTGVPIDNSLQSGEIAGIVIGCLFLFVLVLCGIVYIIRVIKKKKEELLQNALIKDISQLSVAQPVSPHFTNEGNFPYSNGFERQISNDSGMPSSPTSNRSFRQTNSVINEIDYVDPETMEVNVVNSTVNCPNSNTQSPLRRSSDDSLFGGDSYGSRGSDDTQKPGRDVSGYVIAELVVPPVKHNISMTRILETTANCPDDDTKVKAPLKSRGSSYFGGDMHSSGELENTQEPERDVSGYVKARHIITAINHKLKRAITRTTSHDSDQSNQSEDYHQASVLGYIAEKTEKETASDNVKIRSPCIRETHALQDVSLDIKKHKGELDEPKSKMTDKKNRRSQGSERELNEPKSMVSDKNTRSSYSRQNSRKNTENLDYVKAAPMDSCLRSFSGQHDETELSKTNNCEKLQIEQHQVQFINLQIPSTISLPVSSTEQIKGLGKPEDVNISSLKENMGVSCLDDKVQVQVQGVTNAVSASINTHAFSSVEPGQMKQTNNGYITNTGDIVHSQESYEHSGQAAVKTIHIATSNDGKDGLTAHCQIRASRCSSSESKTINNGYVANTDVLQNILKTTKPAAYEKDADDQPHFAMNSGLVTQSGILEKGQSQNIDARTGYVTSTDLSMKAEPNSTCIVWSKNKVQNNSSTGYVTDVPQNKPQHSPYTGYVTSTELLPCIAQNPLSPGYVASTSDSQNKLQSPSNTGYVTSTDVSQSNTQSPSSADYVTKTDVSPSNTQSHTSTGYVTSTDVSQSNTQSPSSADYLTNTDVSPSNTQSSSSADYVTNTAVSQSNTQNPTNTGYVTNTDVSPSNTQNHTSTGYVASTDVSQSNTQSPSSADYVTNTGVSQSNTQNHTSTGYVASTDVSQSNTQSPSSADYVTNTDVSPSNTQSSSSADYVTNTDVSQSNTQSPSSADYVTNTDVSPSNAQSSSSADYVTNTAVSQSNTQSPSSADYVTNTDVSPSNTQSSSSADYVTSTDVSQSNTQNHTSTNYVTSTDITVNNQQNPTNTGYVTSKDLNQNTVQDNSHSYYDANTDS